MNACGKRRKSVNAVLKWVAELTRNGMAASKEGRTEEAEVILIMALYIAKSAELPCLEAKTLNNINPAIKYINIMRHMQSSDA